MNDKHYALKEKCDLQVDELLRLTEEARARKEEAERAGSAAREAERARRELAARHAALAAEAARNEDEARALRETVRDLQATATAAAAGDERQLAALETSEASARAAKDIADLRARLGEEQDANAHLRAEAERLRPEAAATEKYRRDAAACRADLRAHASALEYERGMNAELEQQLQEARASASATRDTMQRRIAFLEEQLQRSEGGEAFEMLSSDEEAEELQVEPVGPPADPGDGQEAGAADDDAPDAPESGHVKTEPNGAEGGPTGGAAGRDAMPTSGAARRSRRQSKPPVPFDPCPAARPPAVQEEPGGSPERKPPAQERGGRKSRGPRPRAQSTGPARGATTASAASLNVGDVGYRFQRYFPEYRRFFSGEVIDILENYSEFSLVNF